MAIVAILAAVAVPSYQDYMTRTRRADAVTALLSLQADQERYRSRHYRYASGPDELYPPPPGEKSQWDGLSSEGHYRIEWILQSVNGTPALSYRAKAVPVKDGLQAHDKACPEFSLGPEGPVTASQEDARCWGS